MVFQVATPPCDGGACDSDSSRCSVTNRITGQREGHDVAHEFVEGARRFLVEGQVAGVVDHVAIRQGFPQDGDVALAIQFHQCVEVRLGGVVVQRVGAAHRGLERGSHFTK